MDDDKIIDTSSFSARHKSFLEDPEDAPTSVLLKTLERLIAEQRMQRLESALEEFEEQRSPEPDPGFWDYAPDEEFLDD